MRKTRERVVTVARFMNGGHLRAAPRVNTLALMMCVAGVASLLITSTALAQVTPAEFGGRWIRKWPASVAAPTTATSLLTVTFSGPLLTVEERAGDGRIRSLKRYALDEAWTPGGLTGVPARAFRSLAPDRLELREMLRIGGAGPTPTALGDVWTLSLDRATLQIERRLPTSRKVATLKTQILTFQRVAP